MFSLPSNILRINKQLGKGKADERTASITPKATTPKVTMPKATTPKVTTQGPQLYVDSDDSDHDSGPHSYDYDPLSKLVTALGGEDVILAKYFRNLDIREKLRPNGDLIF